MVLFQQKPFKEAADIFALDIDGNLHIFELKRWSSKQENLLQVLRYGQIYGQYDYNQLQNMLRKYKDNPNLDLAEKHFEYFNEDLNDRLKSNEFNQEQYFVVITNGIDLDTLNAIDYWKNNGLNIDYVSYKVYEINDKPVLEFYPYNPDDEVLIEEETNNDEIKSQMSKVPISSFNKSKTGNSVTTLSSGKKLNENVNSNNKSLN